MNLNLLNHAMLTQVLHELQSGNYARCFDLGLSAEDIRLMQSLSPSTLSRLAHSSVMWVEFKVDSNVLKNLAEQAGREIELERMTNRALQLGASTEMMYKFFGLSHSDTAARRRVMQIEARRGRPNTLTEEQEHALWLRWRELRGKDSEVEMLDALMMLAEEQNVTLTVVWKQINLYGEP